MARRMRCNTQIRGRRRWKVGVSPVLVLVLGITLGCTARGNKPAEPAHGTRRPPNVLLVITDDQGYGDLGVHGNRDIETPHLDRLAGQGVQFSRFHVSPVCSPTRASLLTGRYNYRTGVVDTFLGRSLMRGDEVTLAERLRAAGYRTGLFGKWHLGDNYPLRCVDQGFDEAVTLKGGGIGQASDPPGGDHYQNPTLYRSGGSASFPTLRPEKTTGYVTDLITSAAIDFLKRQSGRPFFAYVAFNAPHAPLEAPPAYLQRYLTKGLPPDVAKVYAMVTNIDDNVGRLLATLDQLGLTRDTLVVFLNDNGPAASRYNAGLRGTKGTVFDGGIRSPLFVRWPGGFPGGRTIDRIAAHIDVTPTLLEAAGVLDATAPPMDGKSLLPLLRGDAAASAAWPERCLFFQWHRGDVPEKGRAYAVRCQRWKLVGPADPSQPGARPMLFDMDADPAETTDLASQHPADATRLRVAYETWIDDVGRPRGYEPVRIHAGTTFESPTVLTRQDWRTPPAVTTGGRPGHWQVHVANAGTYEVTARFAPTASPATVRLRLGGASAESSVEPGVSQATLKLALPAGDGRLDVEVDGGAGIVGPTHVELMRHVGP